MCYICLTGFATSYIYFLFKILTIPVTAMTYIPIKQSTPRHIASFFDVKTIARLLGNYNYAEMRLMEAQAGWIASVPIAELKIELGYQLYEDAAHVDAMRH